MFTSALLLLVSTAAAETWLQRRLGCPPPNPFADPKWAETNLAVGTGVGINAGDAYVGGYGAAQNYGQNYLETFGTNGQVNHGLGAQPQGNDPYIGVGLGAGMNLYGANTHTAGNGAALNGPNAVNMVDMYNGNYNRQMVNQYSQWGFRRMGGRAMDALRRMVCPGDPTAESGPDVSCYATGDPHYRAFDGSRFDFMDFGEFVFYKSRGRGANEDLEVQIRHGSFQGSSHISSTHSVAFSGGLTCGTRFEIHHRGQKIKITSGSGAQQATGVQGAADLINNTCGPAAKVKDGILHIVFKEYAQGEKLLTLRVQMVSWGLNVWLDAPGVYKHSSDVGICTKKGNWKAQTICANSLFSIYPSGHSCANMARNHKTNDSITCGVDLEAKAKARCNKCPEVVSIEQCVFDTCQNGNADFANEVMLACSLAIKLPKSITVNIGAGINYGTTNAVTAGAAVNYGVNRVRVHNMPPGGR